MNATTTNTTATKTSTRNAKTRAPKLKTPKQLFALVDDIGIVETSSRKRDLGTVYDGCGIVKYVLAPVAAKR